MRCLAHSTISCAPCAERFERLGRRLHQPQTVIRVMPTHRDAVSVVVLTDLADTFAMPLAILENASRRQPSWHPRFGGPTG